MAEPGSTKNRERVLMTNRQMCCICFQMPGVIHYIDGNSDNQEAANLAVLCPKHHAEAVAGKLSAEQIRKAKFNWERGCIGVLMGLARLKI
ncbi:MAG TPA: hypothetical protein PLF13_03630 [candidate division Zixibacteria bacterium]|nr:hypothetical protein [candidate division Zixibacteria bacterium]